ncbi:MAG: 3-dehydroquinate dehydratase [Candidatus Eisenbacteria bacterium]|uniref:3-dehydroquinate dehydratase n=1 Tax=Eiseniibacteriota bacterium TaxID=2212470 RepID=A0A538T8K8_UNCEI|nr:MAG: 3-dehydroquinate dehydratase [Candidatus Eisenbacteria bacterium]
MPRTVWVLHGPNMDLLGSREPELYGRETLQSIDRRLRKLGEDLGLGVECFQTNHEGALIDRLTVAMSAAQGCVINPGGLSHTSVALADTIRAMTIPVVEVHLTNLYAREPARASSLTGAHASGVIMGFGARSYELGLRELASRLKPSGTRGRSR